MPLEFKVLCVYNMYNLVYYEYKFGGITNICGYNIAEFLKVFLVTQSNNFCHSLCQIIQESFCVQSMPLGPDAGRSACSLIIHHVMTSPHSGASVSFGFTSQVCESVSSPTLLATAHHHCSLHLLTC